jgi:hypothetical protein
LDSINQTLMAKLKDLNDILWENRATEPLILDWLSNFAESTPPTPSEKTHALFLLSNFMFFGSRQIRELLKSLYRDVYRYPIVEKIRRDHGDTIDPAVIDPLYRDAVQTTRFLGVGNPSESGCHLLYYFRQENSLPKTLFIHTHEIFSRSGGHPVQLRAPEIRRYIFIDDFCGTGKQGTEYSRALVEDIKRLDATAFVAYYTLFGTVAGMERVRDETLFDEARAIYELDESFRCFSSESRFFKTAPAVIDQGFCEQMCRAYGERMLPPEHALGYDDSQLLIGFHHNTPDNTVPVMWYDEPGTTPWTPIFRRYPKLDW